MVSLNKIFWIIRDHIYVIENAYNSFTYNACIFFLDRIWNCLQGLFPAKAEAALWQPVQLSQSLLSDDELGAHPLVQGPGLLSLQTTCDMWWQQILSMTSLYSPNAETSGIVEFWGCDSDLLRSMKKGGARDGPLLHWTGHQLWWGVQVQT